MWNCFGCSTGKTGGDVIACDYLNIIRCAASPANTWYAGDNSSDTDSTGWIFTSPPDRYWVGGTADWDATQGSKWAYSSGGLAQATVPDVGDN